MGVQIGVLWEKTGKNGKFLTGKLEWPGISENIIIFEAKNRRSEKSPSYIIFTQDEYKKGNETSNPDYNEGYDDDIPI